jgi:hypothetical protein
VIDKNESSFAYSKKYLQNKKADINVFSISYSYDKRANQQYKVFLKEITLDKFLYLNGMSKYILLNPKGEVVMLTSYKDKLKEEDWKYDMTMLKRKIISFLEI